MSSGNDLRFYSMGITCLATGSCAYLVFCRLRLEMTEGAGFHVERSRFFLGYFLDGDFPKATTSQLFVVELVIYRPLLQARW